MIPSNGASLQKPTYSPRAYHLVWADGTNSTLYGSHTNFKLDMDGETIRFITAPAYFTITPFPGHAENISYGFSMDGSGLYFKDPTPGAANDNGTGFLYSGGVAFDPPPAIHSGPVEVHVTSDTPGGSIRYTLDGSPPGPDDPI